jgi:hypothetical protein
MSHSLNFLDVRGGTLVGRETWKSIQRKLLGLDAPVSRASVGYYIGKLFEAADTSLHSFVLTAVIGLI